ncbi:hypothetical protein KA062_00225 [Patescibacteria group bacterium]|nr:hypothetical protein [Patescibacteria group bacterium]
MEPKAEEIKKQLRKFNLMGYADESVKYEDNGKKGKILTRTDGNWKYEDEYYGGEPYSGNETLWYNGKDIFRCVYWGKVATGINFSDIYSFLRKALKEQPNGKCVHRGPEKFTEDNLTYTNECEGNIEEFIQTERIFLDEKEVYIAHFIGGRVNVQK